MVAEFVEQKRRPASAGRFSIFCTEIMIGKLVDLPSSHSKSNGCIRLESSQQIRRSRFSGWAEIQLNSYGNAVTDESPANNNAAISKLKDTVRELETRHET
jgi:hypothetical protein